MFIEEAQVASSTNVAMDSMLWHADLIICCSRFVHALDRSFWLLLFVGGRVLHAITSFLLAEVLGPTLRVVVLILRHVWFGLVAAHQPP